MAGISRRRPRQSGRRRPFPALALAVLLAWALAPLAVASAQEALPAQEAPPVQQAAGAVERGAYLARAGGCFGCHTVRDGGQPLAGGRAMPTPFGTFHTPNITPDPQTGIGAWSDEDFLQAMKQGRRPDGSHYYPTFPYTSYTHMSDADALALKAYLFSLPPVHSPNRPHDLRWPFSWRWLMFGWKLLFFSPGELEPEPDKSPEYNRGAYLVRALAHCDECHTPRNLFGAKQSNMDMAGDLDAPGDETVPNITPDPETGIGGWTRADLVELLRSGTKPDFDNVQGSMAEAVDVGLSHLETSDLEAIAIYLEQLPPIRNLAPEKRGPGT